MLLFPPAKINLGLHITRKRKDGFHQIRTVMIPLGLCDILEIRPIQGKADGIRWNQTGITVEGPLHTNLCYRAWELFRDHCKVPPIEMHLHKQIPPGSGLGGGSSDAALVLEGMNRLAEHPLSQSRLEEFASRLGSDCPFFLRRTPMLAEGRGEILRPIKLPLEGLVLFLFDGGTPVSTAGAYADVTPSTPEVRLEALLGEPVEEWRNRVLNDFEPSVFRRFPGLGRLKDVIYGAGALYASLTGSGSALYGFFRGNPELPGVLMEKLIWKGPLL